MSKQNDKPRPINMGKPGRDWRRSPTRLVKIRCRDGVMRECVEFDLMVVAELAEHYRLLGIDPDPVGRRR